jgi:hypothetical protein
MSESINFFLWVSHGTNVSSENNFYPIQTEFKSIILYSKPLQPIFLDELDEITKNPCKLVLGSCPYIPVENDMFGKHVFLPPLIFNNNEPEPYYQMRVATGLYHYNIKTNYEQPQILGKNLLDLPQNCIAHKNHIYNYRDFLDMYKTNFITYSQIFKLVTDTCKKMNLDSKDILLGIFSCQEVMDTYAKEYTKEISNLIPKQVQPNLMLSNIFTSDNYPENSFISLNVMPINKMIKNWNKIVEITHQGCALNVLSYFNIIPRTSAREQIVCLPMKGTSIFKIIDFINTFIIEKNIINHLGFFVARCQFDDGIIKIANFMLNYDEDNYCVIFKMYKKNYTENTKQSHTGHTVAMFKYNESYYYVDPHQNILQKINISDFGQFINNIKMVTGNNWNFIDLIFIVKNERFPENRPQESSENFINDIPDGVDTSIVVRTPDIKFGGKKLFKKMRNNKKKSIKKRKNKRVKTRKNKRNKNIYVGGNDIMNLDTFERLMINIDKKNNIPTTLSIFEINDI